MRRLRAVVAVLVPFAAGAQDFTAAAANVRPALVSVFVEKVVRAPAPQPGGFPGVPTEGVGSGVVIDTLGHILTCDHVVAGYTDLTVKLADGRMYTTPDVVLVGRDHVTDIAVIQVRGRSRFAPARVGDSDALAVGQPVMALGSPFGLENSASAGIVSALSRWAMPKSTGPDFQAFIQTDATINPGNSGGPLVSIDGSVIGVNSFVRTQRSGMPTGIGFAVPSNLAMAVARELIERGRVVRGFLDITTQAVTRRLQQALSLSSRDGALVAQVAARGPGGQAGLRPGDVIVEFNDTTVADVRGFQTLCAAAAPGNTVRLAVLRDGRRVQLSATLGEWPQPVDAPRAVPVLRHWLGMAVADVSAEDRQRRELRVGVVVSAIEAGGPAADAGIKKDDVILELGGRGLSSAADYGALRRTQAPGDRFLLCRVLRGREVFYTAIEN